MKTIYIDFDDTLMDSKNVPIGKRMGPPTFGAGIVLPQLRQRGHRIVIFTVRGATEQSRKVVADWLDYFHLPYDEITNIKGNADVYVDDKALRFDGDWLKLAEEIDAL